MPKKGEIPSARTSCSIVFYEDALYMYGYIAFSDDIEDNIYKYDLKTEKWEILNVSGEIPESRLSDYLFVHDDQMFCLYGMNFEEMMLYNEFYKK